jgi:hypothetical protein
MSPTWFVDFKVGLVMHTVKYTEDLVLLAKEMVPQGMIDGLIAIGKCYRMEMNVGQTKVMKIKRQASTIHIIIYQKQRKKVKYF